MAQSFFFYDLETSGLNPRHDRIMQFAGQRTDLNLKPIGPPVNLLVRLSDDILPSPEALLVTGITPQKTLAEGISEHELAQKVDQEFFTAGTIAVGYNNLRFDDEFIRHLLWRNFYDPYEWAWSEQRSRWDLLDVVRLTRALRPDDISWPTDGEGRSVNKLELISRANRLKHTSAHDALSDVEALIEITKLIREKQPKLFNYLLELRHKREIAKLVNLENPTPFVYVSGRYKCAEKATVAFPIAPGLKSGTTLVYDLRIDPEELDLAEIAETRLGLPIKELQYNRCPAVAPLGVLDQKSQTRLELPLAKINQNLEKLLKNRGICDRLIEIWAKRPDYPKATDVEDQLYDSFTPDGDKPLIKAVREATADQLADFHPKFNDERLSELLFRYKAREFPATLSSDEKAAWEKYRLDKFQKQLPGYLERMAQLAAGAKDDQLFILEEIQLWVEANMPLAEEI